MTVRRLLRRVRNDPKFLCKYLVWTNLLCLSYFIITEQRDRSHDGDLTHQDLHLNTFKFKDFDLDRWKEAEHFKLRDSNGTFFS